MVKILSPVTSFDAAVGVISSGAEEIYCGVRIPGVKYPGLSTRPDYCSLSTYEELGRVVRYAHDHDVKTIVTTDVPFMAEWLEKELKHHVRSCIRQGVDAIIGSDLGIILMLKDMDLDVPIFASTYLASTNYEAVDFLKNLGIGRVILERHITIKEIEEIVRCSKDVEIEVFVHGPGCSNINVNCYGCYGGRVKPRKNVKYDGLLRPTCRVTFDVYKINDVKNEKMASIPILDAYSFCSFCKLPRLVKTGVTGFKIVDRCGPPAYQIWTTKIYREFLNLIEHGEIDLFLKKLQSVRNNPRDLGLVHLSVPEACKEKRCYYSPLFHTPYRFSSPSGLDED